VLLEPALHEKNLSPKTTQQKVLYSIVARKKRCESSNDGDGGLYVLSRFMPYSPTGLSVGLSNEEQTTWQLRKMNQCYGEDTRQKDQPAFSRHIKNNYEWVGQRHLAGS
jgi:hypothetical protein